MRDNFFFFVIYLFYDGTKRIEKHGRQFVDTINSSKGDK